MRIRYAKGGEGGGGDVRMGNTNYCLKTLGVNGILTVMEIELRPTFGVTNVTYTARGEGSSAIV